MTGQTIAFKDETLNNKTTDVSQSDRLPVEDDFSQEISLVLKSIVELLGDVNNNLSLLNVRFEEAFRTGIHKGDI